ncbi:MAG TPA: hypothetical protein PKX05_01410 [bacterium]|nr:hypothetical protein [bacterium]
MCKKSSQKKDNEEKSGQKEKKIVRIERPVYCNKPGARFIFINSLH